MPSSSTTYAALLRAVNVGGRTVPMAELRDLVGALGFEDVVTYVQSGNVVFSTTQRQREDRVRRTLEQALAERFGAPIAVVVRASDELRAVAAEHPFAAVEPAAAKLHVAFLDAAPQADAVARLDPERSPPDAFEVRGREVFLHFPNGSGRSKLTIGYFERVLGVTATARNWNTVQKLAELAAR